MSLSHIECRFPAPPNVCGMQQLRDVAVRLAMDEPVGDDLAMAAAHALARGIDSPSLRVLAGLSRGESREAVDLFRQAMDELGSPVPDEDGARLHLMRQAAATIVAAAVLAAGLSRRRQTRVDGRRVRDLRARLGGTGGTA